MPSTPHIMQLAAPADSVKGGRSYVHGADIVTALGDAANEIEHGAIANRIEFHAPVTTLSVLYVAEALPPADKKECSVMGEITSPDGGVLDFVIFSSPFELVAYEPPREFNEERIFDRCAFDIEKKRASVRVEKGATFAEHLSSMMKFFCSRLLPHHQRWIFARLTSNAALPRAPRDVAVEIRRITLDRFVTAGVRVDGETWGVLDFIGGDR